MRIKKMFKFFKKKKPNPETLKEVFDLGIIDEQEYLRILRDRAIKKFEDYCDEQKIPKTKRIKK